MFISYAAFENECFIKHRVFTKNATRDFKDSWRRDFKTKQDEGTLKIGDEMTDWHNLINGRVTGKAIHLEILSTGEISEGCVKRHILTSKQSKPGGFSFENPIVSKNELFLRW